ncbi:MAG: DinB family protein [Acidobacteria bacterium]|nr:DinB family protein [Acidobacteriota bacterium]
MNRIELEIKLNQDRAWLLEQFAELSQDDLQRGITTSRVNPQARWSAKDHLAHLIGIEVAFNGIIQRHLEGNAHAIGIAINEDGSRRSQEEIMEVVHVMNEKWVNEHHEKSLVEIVALGQKVRAETLALIAGLSDDQLNEKVPGAPWGDATVGSIIAINGDHARQHFAWVTDGLEGKK